MENHPLNPELGNNLETIHPLYLSQATWNSSGEAEILCSLNSSHTGFLQASLCKNPRGFETLFYSFQGLQDFKNPS